MDLLFINKMGKVILKDILKAKVDIQTCRRLSEGVGSNNVYDVIL